MPGPIFFIYLFFLSQSSPALSSWLWLFTSSFCLKCSQLAMISLGRLPKWWTWWKVMFSAPAPGVPGKSDSPLFPGRLLSSLVVSLTVSLIFNIFFRESDHSLCDTLFTLWRWRFQHQVFRPAAGWTPRIHACVKIFMEDFQEGPACIKAGQFLFCYFNLWTPKYSPCRCFVVKLTQVSLRIVFFCCWRESAPCYLVSP